MASFEALARRLQSHILPFKPFEIPTYIWWIMTVGYRTAKEPSSDKIQPFHGSAECTVGVELELQILDGDGGSGELSPGALRILDACEEEGLEGVDREFLL